MAARSVRTAKDAASRKSVRIAKIGWITISPISGNPNAKTPEILPPPR